MKSIGWRRLARISIAVEVAVLATLGFEPHAGKANSHYRILYVPSDSMAPTIQYADLVLVEPPPAGNPVVQRCDVVVVRAPGAVGEKERDYFRRVVALPGDRVAYVDGRLSLDGKVVPRESMGLDHGATIYRETLPSGCNYLIREIDDRYPQDNTAETTVPPGTFYVLADNRDQGMDSRMAAFGTVPIGNLRGRAVSIYWANDRTQIGARLSPGGSPPQ
jgi:signal peptidase I